MRRKDAIEDIGAAIDAAAPCCFITAAWAAARLHRRCARDRTCGGQEMERSHGGRRRKPFDYRKVGVAQDSAGAGLSTALEANVRLADRES
ncbi:MAG: hypothetical protein IPG16_01410 [Comamonadaceae bacterium]|nr:hypothetical protein [Comamonadaceae bacterium]